MFVDLFHCCRVLVTLKKMPYYGSEIKEKFYKATNIHARHSLIVHMKGKDNNTQNIQNKHRNSKEKGSHAISTIKQGEKTTVNQLLPHLHGKRHRDMKQKKGNIKN